MTSSGLLDGLRIETAIVAGFDWGGLASCVATALWPERVAGLVSLTSYDVIDVDRLGHAFPPSLECAMWYPGRPWLSSLRSARRQPCDP